MALVVAAANPVAIVFQQGHTSFIQDMVFSPDSKFLASGAMDSRVIVWEAHRGRVAGNFTLPAEPWGVSLDRGGRTLAATQRTGEARKSPAAIIFDISSNKRLLDVEWGADGTAVALSGDGKHVYVAMKRAVGGGNVLAAYALPGGKQEWQAALPAYQGSMAYDEKQQRLYLVGYNGVRGSGAYAYLEGGRLHCFDAKNGALLRSADQPVGDAFDAVAVDPSGRYLVASQTTGTKNTVVMDANTLAPLKSLGWKASKVAFSGDGTRVLLSTNANSVVEMEWQTERIVWAYRGPNGSYLSAYSPDGTLLAVSQRTYSSSTPSAAPAASRPDGLTIYELDPSKAARWQPVRQLESTVSIAAPNPITSADGRWLHAPAGWIDLGSNEQRPTKYASLSECGSRLLATDLHYGKWAILADIPEERPLLERQHPKLSAVRCDKLGRVALVVEQYPIKAYGIDLVTQRELFSVSGGPKTFNARAELSEDGTVAAYSLVSEKLTRLINMANGATIKEVAGDLLTLSADGRLLVTQLQQQVGATVQRQDGAVVMQLSEPVLHAAFSADSRFLVLRAPNSAVSIIELATGKRLAYGVSRALVDLPTRYWTALGIFDAPEQALKRSLPDGLFGLSGNGRFWLRRVDSAIQLLDKTSMDLVASVTWTSAGAIIATKEGYYQVPKAAMNKLLFRVGEELYEPSAFDLRFNRPDKVMRALGYADEAQIRVLQTLADKRLRKYGFDPNSVPSLDSAPRVQMTSAPVFATTSSKLDVSVSLQDDGSPVAAVRAWVNSVPVFGSRGKSLPKPLNNKVALTLPIPLLVGTNEIEIAAVNTQGIESAKQAITVERTGAPPAARTLYVAAIGVSDYKDQRFNLTYAAKDAQDLAELLKQKKRRYTQIEVRQLTNGDVTKEKIASLAGFFAASKPEDGAVLFVAGHGLVDDNLDYYFATHDVDFAAPAARGVAYEQLEALLDEIPARDKLVLMDTCHSGEIDKESMQIAKLETGVVQARAVGRGLVKKKLGAKNDEAFRSMQDLFADFRRGSGATVISSAGGAEYAFESAEWKNGVFTYALLQALNTKDAAISVDDLRGRVVDRVKALTAGQQTPTVRRERPAQHFVLN